MQGNTSKEDFKRIQNLYDCEMPDNNIIHDLIYPFVYGEEEYIGQFSDNSACEILFMGQKMQLPMRSRVLDIGCGTAPVACFLAEQLGWQITGIDISRVPLEKAHSRINECNLTSQIRIVHGNIYTYSFNEKFDGAYGTGAFCHFDATNLFARCRDLLRNGGVLAFMERIRIGDIEPDDWQKLTTEWACPNVYSADEYTTLLREAGFAVRVVKNLTPTFRQWQKKSVSAREDLKEQIINLTSKQYYETSLRFAAYENDMTQADKLGYAMIIAEAA
jgi:cyclopropane fatty-acyl-phospholipid synthase-like methyltransferase